MADTADTRYLLKPVDISIGIQHHRVVIGFISKECTQRRQHSRTGPHAHPYNPFTVTRHLIARIIDDVIDDENKHGHHHRHTQTAFTDDTAQRRTDKEENKARQRKRQFLVPGRHVTSQAGFRLRYIKALEAPIARRTFRTADSRRHNLLLLHQSSRIEQTVHIVIAQAGRFYLHRIRLAQGIGSGFVSTCHSLFIVRPPHTVVLYFHGVDAGLQHSHILTIGLIAHKSGVHHIEIRVEFYNRMLLHERFPTIGHILLVHILRLQIFKLLTAVKVQIKVLFVGRHFQSAGVRLDYLRILKSFLEIINQHIVQHTRLTVLMLYVKVVAVYLVIKHPFGNIHFGRLLLHGNQQRP